MPTSINEDGTVVGFFLGSNYYPIHGFVRDKHGAITTLDGPSAGFPGTVANGINEDGAIVGSIGFHGFVLRKRGSFTTFDVPDAGPTVAISINGNGVIAGKSGNNPIHGFVRDAQGTIVTFDAPGAGFETNVVGINYLNTIAGNYIDDNDVFHGFVRDQYGIITTFDAAQFAQTFVTGINNDGTIVGYYYGIGNYHGFVRNRHGSITTFDVPGSLSGSTQALSINDEGDVAGNYEDSNFATHCFVWRR